MTAKEVPIAWGKHGLPHGQGNMTEGSGKPVYLL